ncbi:ciliary microtubule inner protein 2A [Eudromia elegans]
MAATRGSSLFPPQPHYIPGYEGFVPQYSYRFGETFGKTTFRLLTDPSVRKSPRSLLAPLPKLRFVEDFTGTEHEIPDYIPVHPERRAQTRAGPGDTAPPRRPRPSHPGLALAYEYERVIPARRLAMPQAAEEEEEGAPDTTAAKGPNGAAVQAWSLPSIPETKPVKTDGAALPAAAGWAHAESCDRLPRLDVPHAIQQKATSGYTGYIPRYTWITGVNYIQGVKDAMIEFDRNQFLLRNPLCEFGKRLPQSYWPNNRIYTSAGLIPFYTGFVPTLRHSYALTYGNSTRKAYQKEQRRQACALRKKTLMMPVQHSK